MHDLKQRATSMAHSQFKQEKHEMARREARRRLFWVRSIVLAQKFIFKLKKKVHEAAQEKQRNKELLEQGDMYEDDKSSCRDDRDTDEELS